MVVDILFFASLKDHFGPSASIELNPGQEIRNLVKSLKNIAPSSAPLLEASRFAVNDMIVGEDYLLEEGDNISILPPSSGG